jgi:hypothetical protein
MKYTDLGDNGNPLFKQGVAEADESRHRFIRHNIWTVMDGDEEVMQHPVEGDPFFSAKKFMRDLDDEGYEFTHVVSPKGTVTYLPQFDPRNFPKDDVDESVATEMTPNWAKYVLDQLYNSNGSVTMTDLFDEHIPGLHAMFMATAQEHGLDPEEDFQDVEHEVIVKLEDFVKGGHGLDEASLAQMRDYFNQADSDSVKVDRNYDAPSKKQNPPGVPPEIQALVNKMYHAGKISPQEFEVLRKFQQRTKINVGIREADKNPYAIGMSQAMKSTGDKPPLKKSTINKAHAIARAIKKGD